MAYRLFDLKIVADDKPNSEGRWIERVVPEEWPGDDRAQQHMLREPPGFDYVPTPGFHVVEIREATPGPANQPGSMHETLAARTREATRQLKAGYHVNADGDVHGNAPDDIGPRFK